MTNPAPTPPPRPATPPQAPTPEQTALLAELAALAPVLKSMDPRDPAAAERALEKALPSKGPALARIEALAKKGDAAGWLMPRAGGPKVRFGRLAKDLQGFSVDFVRMEGPAAGHTHTNGEINFGWRVTGEPRFDGRPPGWVVFAPGSHHVPTVTGGEMLLLYFLPGGAVAWDPPPAK